MTESIHSAVLNEFATTSDRFMQTSIKYHNYTVYISYKCGSPGWPFWFKWYKANTLPGSTFQGYFLYFWFCMGWAAKTKIHCSGQLVHVTWIHSNHPQEITGKVFLHTLSFTQPLEKVFQAQSCPWVSSLSAAALIGSVYPLMSASTPLSCFIYYIKLLRPACIAKGVVVIRLF